VRLCGSGNSINILRNVAEHVRISRYIEKVHIRPQLEHTKFSRCVGTSVKAYVKGPMVENLVDSQLSI
jgi:hypothetical protein